MQNSTVLEFLLLVALRIFLFLGCRKYLLRSLYSDLQTLSSDPASDLTPPVTPNTTQDSPMELSVLPPPATQAKTGKSSGFNAKLHSTVARTVFSLMFAESSMLFLVLILQAIGMFSPGTRQLSWQFSLAFLMAVILVAVPLSVSLLLAIGAGSKSSSSASSRKYILGPRILIGLVPVGFYLFFLSKVPLPLALTTSDTFTAYLARLIVIGTIILGLLSGFGAISNAWPYIPWLSPSRGEPTEQDVSTAEYSLQSVRNDLHERRAVAERRASAQVDNTGWLSRVTPNFRGGDGLNQELRGLESLEYQMSRNVESLRARRNTAIHSRTLRGRIFNFSARVFAFYCVLRIVSCLINVLFPSRRTASQSQTDLIADLLARVLTPVSLNRDAIASLAHQLSLALVGLIILTSVRRVLKGATRALRVTSRNLGASLMMLILAQLMGIYLLSTVVQLRNSFPPPPDAEVNLFSTIPQFELFGAVFDWAFLLAAGASGFVRWGNDRVNGVGDI